MIYSMEIELRQENWSDFGKDLVNDLVLSKCFVILVTISLLYFYIQMVPF